MQTLVNIYGQNVKGVKSNKLVKTNGTANLEFGRGTVWHTLANLGCLSYVSYRPTRPTKPFQSSCQISRPRLLASFCTIYGNEIKIDSVDQLITVSSLGRGLPHTTSGNKEAKCHDSQVTFQPLFQLQRLCHPLPLRFQNLPASHHPSSSEKCSGS